jgi:hypothetical protein
VSAVEEVETRSYEMVLPSSTSSMPNPVTLKKHVDVVTTAGIDDEFRSNIEKEYETLLPPPS